MFIAYVTYTFVYSYIMFELQNHEKRAKRRNKKKAHFTNFITFLQSINKEVIKVITNNNSFNILLSVFYYNNILCFFCIR